MSAPLPPPSTVLPASPPPRPPRWRRWRTRLWVGLLTGLILLAFLPTLAAQCGLVQLLLARGGRSLQGTLSLEGASLGWFRPVELRDLRLHDRDGNLVAQVQRLRSTRSLLGLLLHPRDPGEFWVSDATLNLVETATGNNLEEVLAPLLSAPAGPPRMPRDGASPPSLRFHGDRLRVRLQPLDATQSATLQLEQLDGETTPAGMLRVAFSGSLLESQGEISAEFRTEPGQLRAALHATQFPLGSLIPGLKSLDPSLRLAGTLDADLVLTRDGPTDCVELQGRVQGRNLLLVSDALQGDRLQLLSLDIPAHLQLRDGLLTVTHASLQSDLGTARLRGAMPVREEFEQLAMRTQLDFAADLDLAKLTKLLPRVMRLQADTWVDAGRLTASLRGEAGERGNRWVGRFHTSQLVGQSRGTPVRWEQPLSVDLTVRPVAGDLPELERLDCVADFLKLTGSGNRDRLSVEGSCDLDRLRTQLAQWVDLGEVQLQGDARGSLTWTRKEQDRFTLKGEATLSAPTRRGAADAPAEPLRIEVNLGGAWSAARGASVSGGGITVQAGGDGLGLYVVEPITRLDRPERGLVRCIVRGQLERWQPRLAPWVEAARGIQASGSVDLTVLVRLEDEQLRLNDLDATLGNGTPGGPFRFRGLGLEADEPQVKLKSSGVYRLASNRLLLEATRLESATARLQLAGVQCDLQRGRVQTQGSVGVDLARLQRLLAPPQRAGDAVHGTVSGRVELSGQGAKWAIKTELVGEQLALGEPSRPSWRESRLTVGGGLEWDGTRDRLQCQSLKLSGTGLGCTLNGSVANLASTQDVALSGELRYELEKLEPQLRQLLGPQLVVKGAESRAFKLEGSLARGGVTTLVAVDGSAGLGWREVKYLGADVGAASVSVTLEKGWLVLPPIETQLNQGSLRILTGARLEPGPAELVLFAGTRIDHAVVTPQMCAEGLGYLAPLLAQAAQAEGQFSLSIDQGRIPLDRPEAGDLTGKLTLHAVNVGAGPLLRELSVLSNQPAQFQLAREQVVPIRMSQGRVYHENLRLAFPELTITTSGSVGLDGTLDLVAEMPVPPKWLGKAQLASLGKQPVRLPIRGTVQNPRIDPQALKAAIAQYARDTAREALRDEAERRLQKLLPIKP